MFKIREEEKNEFRSLLELIYSEADIRGIDLTGAQAYAHRTDKGYRGLFALVPEEYILTAMILWDDEDGKARYMGGDWVLMKEQLEDYWSHRAVETLDDILDESVSIDDFRSYLGRN